jgi:anaerobic sulfite reductase subunit B
MTTADLRSAPPRHPLTPARYRVAWHRFDAADTATLALDPVDEALPAGLPGQFHMLCAVGVGEIPISLSGCAGGDGRVEHTIRAVGAVSRALTQSWPGTIIGCRGPFGTAFDLDADGGDLLIVAGGLGLAPLRPTVLAALADRARYRRVLLVVGARTPDQLLYPDQLADWGRSGAQVAVTVDAAPRGWHGHVGVVTTLLASLELDPAATTALVCGPEPMMRFTARHLLDRGVADGQIQVSLERSMHCAVGICGRCQLGPWLVCRDGAVLPYPAVGPHWEVRER